MPNQSYEGFSMKSYVFYPIIKNKEAALISFETKEEAETYIKGIIDIEKYPLVILETYEQ